MSSISFNEVVSGWESFLSRSARNHIRIKNTATNTFVKGQTSARPTGYYLRDILARHKTVHSWFDDLMLKNSLKGFTILFREDSGGSGTGKVRGMVDTDYNVEKRLEFLKQNQRTIEFPDVAKPIKTEPMNTELTTSPPPVTYPQQPPPPQYAPSYPPQINGNGLGSAVMQTMGGLAAAANAAGLGLGDFIDLKKEADRAKEYKEELSKLKIENETLIIRNRNLEGKVESATRDKELSLQLERLDKRGFLDTEAGQKILGSLPEIASMIMNARNGQAPQNGAALGMGNPALSEAKKKLVGYLSDQNVTDAMATLLENVLALTAMNPAFANEVNQLIQQYYATSNN